MDSRTIAARRPLEIVCLLVIGGILLLSGCAAVRGGKDRVAKASARRSHTIELPQAQSPALPSGHSENPLTAQREGCSLGDPSANLLPDARIPSVDNRVEQAGFQSPHASPADSLDFAARRRESELREPSSATRPRGGAVVHVGERDFDREVLGSDAPVLVDFYASWCGPCRALAPRLDEVAAENPHAKVVKVDIDDSPALAARYGVTSVPSLIAFKDGKAVAKQKGVASKSRMVAMLGQ